MQQNLSNSPFEFLDNPFTLISISMFDQMLTVEQASVQETYTWQGDVRIFNDGNGVGDTWLDYEADLSFTPVPFLSDGIVATESPEDYLACFVANAKHSELLHETLENQFEISEKS